MDKTKPAPIIQGLARHSKTVEIQQLEQTEKLPVAKSLQQFTQLLDELQLNLAPELAHKHKQAREERQKTREQQAAAKQAKDKEASEKVRIALTAFQTKLEKRRKNDKHKKLLQTMNRLQAIDQRNNNAGEDPSLDGPPTHKQQSAPTALSTNNTDSNHPLDNTNSTNSKEPTKHNEPLTSMATTKPNMQQANNHQTHNELTEPNTPSNQVTILNQDIIMYSPQLQEHHPVYEDDGVSDTDSEAVYDIDTDVYMNNPSKRMREHSYLAIKPEEGNPKENESTLSSDDCKHVDKKRATKHEHHPDTPTSKSEDPTKKQSTITDFYNQQQQQNTEVLTTHTTEDCSLSYPTLTSSDISLFPAPTTLQDWLKVLNAKEVTVPSNGACFYYAIHGIQTHYLKGQHMKMEKRHNAEGTYYLRAILQTLHDYLPRMLKDGSTNLEEMYTRYKLPLPMPPKSEALTSILTRIQQTATKKVDHGLLRQHWAGTEEIMATVWYFRVPVFVWDVWPDRDSENGPIAKQLVYIQMYSIELKNPDDPESPEVVKIRSMESRKANQMYQYYFQHRSIPLILTLHHHLEAAQIFGHFNSVRMEDKMYSWADDEHSPVTMNERIRSVLEHMDMYVPPMEDPQRTNRQLDYDSIEDLMETSDSDFSPSSPLTERGPLSNTPSSLTSVEHEKLLGNLVVRQRRRSDLALIWNKAESLNIKAVRCLPEPDATLGIKKGGDIITMACWKRVNAPEQVKLLLQSLPYPEVALALLPHDLKLRTARKLIHQADPGDLSTVMEEDVGVVLVLILAVLHPSPGGEDIRRAINWINCHQTKAWDLVSQIRSDNWASIRSTAAELQSNKNESPRASMASDAK